MAYFKVLILASRSWEKPYKICHHIQSPCQDLNQGSSECLPLDHNIHYESILTFFMITITATNHWMQHTYIVLYSYFTGLLAVWWKKQVILHESRLQDLLCLVANRKQTYHYLPTMHLYLLNRYHGQNIIYLIDGIL
jgi:hypothetical protein